MLDGSQELGTEPVLQLEEHVTTEGATGMHELGNREHLCLIKALGGKEARWWINVTILKTFYIIGVIYHFH